MKLVTSRFLPLLTIGVVVLGSATLAHADRKTDKVVAELHARAWDQNLDSVNAVPAARFGFYAYRSLAVEHPEVYLQADQLVSATLEDLPGSRLAFRSRDVRDIQLYLRLARRETKGGAFGWGMLTIIPDSIFDSNEASSEVNWLDMRSPSVATLLRATSPRFSTLESSVLRFAQLTRTPNPPTSLFVLVDGHGAGYLVGDTILWRAGLSDRPVKNWEEISPVLLFNARSVYSAITGRDDRATDSSLAKIVSRLGKPANLGLKSDELRRVNRLKEGSLLTGPTAFQLAVLVSSGLSDRKQPVVDSAWTALTHGDTSNAPCGAPQVEEACFWGNRLSRLTATLASDLGSVALAEGLSKAQDRYLSWAGRRVFGLDTTQTRVEAWGCLWSYDLLVSSIDDIARTRAGSSTSQALAMSSVLDLSGIDHFQLAVQMGDKQIPDQQWLIASGGRFQFNLGVWTPVPDTITPGVKTPMLLVSGFTLRGNPVKITPGSLCGNLDNFAVSEQLTKISRQMPLATLAYVSPTGEVVPFQKLLMDLTDDRFTPIAPLWPSATAQ